ncbi:MAG: hypothetical protein A2046_03345 [Bacteroidetes bacterium GWA2_30_7]|nr:MAG: hypothetical protein A2046_03345 [Bacteroidetes bacterium GWA2_30_7]
MNKQTISNFVNAINNHDVESICSHCADEHIFIDSHGNELKGKVQIKIGWIAYFQWFPDYKIEITNIFTDGDTHAAFGFASGTFKAKQKNNNENYWRLPASWKIILENNKVSLWQVYADTKIPFDIIERNK